jgi:hypothetical protein
MAIVYRIYSNNDTGGLVDFSAPLASTTGLTYTFSPLGASTDTTFVVRAFDPEADLEEANTEALVRVVIGPDGAEVGGRPNPPHALSLTPSFGGGCRVSWAYAPAEQCGIPAGFHVYLTPVDSVHNSIPTGWFLTSPAGSVTAPCCSGPSRYRTTRRQSRRSTRRATERTRDRSRAPSESRQRRSSWSRLMSVNHDQS